jgi:penicillin-binding protein 2
VGLGKNEKYNAAKMEEHLRDHSLYVAFAPAEEPTIALAVIVENAGFGSASAAPIARRVFDYWLLGQYPNEQDLLAVSKGQAGAPLGKPRLASEVPLLGSAPADPSVPPLDAASAASTATPQSATATPKPAAQALAVRSPPAGMR